jgi:hypothetical protein
MLTGVNWCQSFGRVSGVLRQLTLTGVNGCRYSDAGSPAWKLISLASLESESHLMRDRAEAVAREEDTYSLDGMPSTAVSSSDNPECRDRT